MKVTDIHPAYIAGLADSDGSFSIVRRHCNRKNVNYYACFQLSWKESEESLRTLNLIKAKYGGAICKPAPSNNTYGRPQMLKYFCQARHLEALIKDILPFLKLKRKQARLILFLRSSIGNYGNKRSRPEKTTIFQHGLYLKAKELNTKNSGNRFGVKHASS